MCRCKHCNVDMFLRNIALLFNICVNMSEKNVTVLMNRNDKAMNLTLIMAKGSKHKKGTCRKKVQKK